MGGGGVDTACSMVTPAGWIVSSCLSDSAAGDKVEDETSGESVVVAVAFDARRD